MLSKCMYSDPSCKELGLQYGQVRQKAVLTNAGWFSHLGEKLGVGDLSMEDLQNIFSNIPPGETFFALSESTCLSLPLSLDRLAPGLEYIVEHAIWAVNCADILKLDSSLTVQYLDVKDGINYIKFPRSIAKTNWVDLAVPKYIKRVKTKAHWGLDVYYMYDGAAWAAGDYSQCYEAASKAAYESLWDTDPDIIGRYVILTSYDKEVIDEMQHTSGHKCNNLIAKLLGKDVAKCVDYMLKTNGFAYYLDLIDNKEYDSSSIKGLPPNLLAYRIDD